ncbi:hypothetical protein ABNW53_000307 [Salmonella enterica subsp. enterica serovar Sandiego]
MKERGIIDGLTMNQLAERNAEYVTEISRLKARCAALASDNAALKYQEPTLTAMMACLEAFYADEDVPERAMMGGYNILRKSVNTPATDAFLAEVRASALDEFAKVQDEQAKKYYALSPGCSGQNECQFAAGQAWYYAECIRKGAAQ